MRQFPDRSPNACSKYLLGIALAAGSIALTAPAHAQLTLSADSEPTDKPWKMPATIAYTRNGDGSSFTTIDAYLKYNGILKTKGDDNFASSGSWSVAGFIHKDNTADAPRNDRGVVLGYSRLLVFDYPNNFPVMSTTWNAKVSVGKSLQQVTDTPVPIFTDRNKDREQLYVTGFLQPAKQDSPHHTASSTTKSAPRQMDMYFLWETGLYSDHASGGNGKGTGRLNGARGKLEWNVFPLGIIAADNKVGAYGVAPVITLSAQVQHDLSASGTRKKDTYRLYAASLTLEFETIVADGSVGRVTPSLNFTRSVGADLLTGRAYEGKTEIALGFTF
ncbi:hypothetical protein GJ700_09185 [Duganella sp. FT92W]|uniref:Transporter n=1 Tax=Pseudoduganella rivuli TaxID=2666085 RepID=A0A7X2ILF1_9BURK|nr:hypothetical protein [Pseudoduganella rivuli]MRV71893.1 hypothetical protein [Pseudoduganella rivuli]